MGFPACASVINTHCYLEEAVSILLEEPKVTLTESLPGDSYA